MFRFWKRRLTRRSPRAARVRRPSPRPRVELLEDRTLLSVGLVTDINTNPSGSSPSGFVALGGAVYFFADDGQHGVELWKSTSSSTQLVKDINPGSASAGLPVSPSPVVQGGALYFLADGGANGIQLWKSDGSAGGTAPLTGAAPGAVAYANQVAAANGLVFFTDPSTGQLWKTDGTAGNTAAVTDGNGNPISFAFDPTKVGNSLYFSGQQSGSSGSQTGLWKTNGAAGGTTFLKALAGSVSGLTDVNGTAFFLVTTAGAGGTKDVALWTSNGSSSGTTLVHDFGSVAVAGPSQVSDLTAFNGKLYFAGDDRTASPDPGTQLWVSDGSGPGTHAVAGAGSGLGTAPDLTAFNGSLYFAASGTGGQTLWQIPGTSGTPAQVRDGNGNAVVTTGILSAAGTSLYFAGSNAAGSGLWQTNGTAAGTALVRGSITPGVLPGGSAALGGTLYFAADDGAHGTELWSSNGTGGGTGIVADVNPGASANPQAITDVGGTAFFLADDGSHGVELWRSDGTAGGTALVKDLAPGKQGSLALAAPPRLLNVNGTLYFFASDGNPADGAVQLWKSDGTAAGTVLVKGFTPRQDGPFGYLDGLADTPTVVNGKVFFVADDGVHGLELWQSDGTAAGTTLVQDLNAGPDGSNPGQLTAVGGSLFFTAGDGTRAGLWQTDGFTTTFLQAGASNLANANGTLLFTAPGAQNVPALWKTTGGTPVLVASLGQGTSARLPTAAGSTLFFLVDGSGSEALWASNGTPGGTGALQAFPGTQPVSEPTAVGSTLYFIVGGAGLWASNGTPAGTGEVMGVTSSAGFFDLTNVGGTLFFAANNTTFGQELWSSNGTPGGTGVFQNIAPGPADSWPHAIAAVGGKPFLAANDGSHGVELFGPAATSRGSTTTALSASASAVTAGQSVTFTAFVQSSQGALDGGSVTFLDGQTPLGTVPVVGGGAAISAALGVGGHSVTAVYSGNVNFTGSSSGAVGVTVTPTGSASTTTTLGASSGSVPVGQFVTFTATVKPTRGGNVDGGSVDFKDGTHDLGTAHVGPNGVATLSAALAQGSHNVVAVYLGDATFAGSTSGGASVTVTPSSQPATTTLLAASATGVAAGQSVTFTATVRPNQGGNVDGGQVDFRDGQVDLGRFNVDGLGTASVTVVLPAGVHSVTAVYSGNAHFGGSISGGVTVGVTQASNASTTGTTLDVSSSTVTSGNSVQLTATVTSTAGSVSAGSVEFILDDQTDLGSVGVDAHGSATLSPTLAIGSHHVTAVYTGGGGFASSASSPVDVTVTPAGATGTSTFLTSSAANVPAGQSVTFTATVKPIRLGGNVDGGQVDFSDNGQDLGHGDVNVTTGVATLTLALAPGPHHVVATYSGDANFAGSVSSAVDVMVAAAPTTTTLSASSSSVNAGDPVTFTASVMGAGAVDGGQVLFLDNGRLFASASVDPSTGTARVTAVLPPGGHQVTAAYQGDASFAMSTSSPVEVTVAQPAPLWGDVTLMTLPIITQLPSHISAGPGPVTQSLVLWNFGTLPLQGPLFIVVHGLRNGVRLRGAAGFVRHGRTRDPFVVVMPPAGVVQPFDIATVLLPFSRRPGGYTITVSAGLPPM